MNNFSIENIAEDIHFSRTITYFKEVISSYQNENYRSAVVMLWSVAVCDIVYKLESLIDIYSDATARLIIQEMTALQDANPTSSSWEITLIDDVFKKTKLLDSSEYENLRFLQKQRHLSAHPVLNQNKELHSPNKDTVRSLLRNTLEGLLTKPPFYTNKILEELLADLADSAEALNTKQKVNQYIESRYLRRLKPDTEMILYRAFWKLTFKLQNDDCKKYRKINLHVLECISARHPALLAHTISDDQDYYGNIASEGMALTYAVYYLSKNASLYECLPTAAKLKISHFTDTNSNGKILGWFVKDSLEHHFNDLLLWTTSEAYPTIDDELWDVLKSFEDSPEWEQSCCILIGAYYACSRSFNTADARFQDALQPHLKEFNLEALRSTFERVEANSQAYGRGRAESDHKKLIERVSELDPAFNYVQFPHFQRIVEANQ